MHLFMYFLGHTAYTKVSINEQMVEITMGPLQWPIFRWFLSSQVYKSEIHLLENKRRECFYDVCPRLYCYPIMWHCCHKSYSSYYWPCCCETVRVGTLCDGDSDTSNYLLIYLTNQPTEFTSMCFKRCSPCPLGCSCCWCCIYNRIGVSFNQKQNLVLQAENLGYPLRINPNISNVGLAGNDANAYSQMNDVDDAPTANGIITSSPVFGSPVFGDAATPNEPHEPYGNGYTAPEPPQAQEYAYGDKAEDEYRPPI